VSSAGTKRKVLRRGGQTLAILAAIPLIYLTLALLGGLIPANWSWRPPDRGVTIFVQTNGVHTWIAVPTVTPEMDWRPLMPADHIRDPRLAGDYLAIGYGNREFYLNTPAWKDLTVRRALGAAFGNGPSLVHVYHERQLAADADQRPIVLTREQYRRLVRFIDSSFDRDAQGRTIPLIGKGYGPRDIFYNARGGYNLFYTCNEWTGAALREAGVRVGIWTPFSVSVMERFRDKG
jgi:uncharacterized protein (TIGR02117 family)